MQKKALKMISHSKTGVSANVMTLTLLSSILGHALGCDVMAMEASLDFRSVLTGYFLD